MQKTIQVPLFDGMLKSFSLFWTKSKACAEMNGFQNALKECPEKELPSFEAEELEEGSKAHDQDFDTMMYLIIIMRAQSD